MTHLISYNELKQWFDLKRKSDVIRELEGIKKQYGKGNYYLVRGYPVTTLDQIDFNREGAGVEIEFGE